MYAYKIVGILCSAAIAAAATAAPASISFRETFTTLASKTSRTSDQAFFENEVLKGLAKREPVPYQTRPNNWQYVTAPDTPPIGSFNESVGKDATHVAFHASPDAANLADNCLTLSEAERELLAQGWTYRKETFLAIPGEDIGSVYEREGVVLEAFNYLLLTPIFDPTDSQDVIRKQVKKVEAQRKERLKIKRGTDTYANLCVTSVNVSFKR